MIQLLCAQNAAADVDSLSRRFEFFKSEFEVSLATMDARHSEMGKLGASVAGESTRLLGRMMEAHDDHDHLRVILIAEDLYSKPSSLSEQENRLAGIALSSSLFKIRSFRAAAQVCLSLSGMYSLWGNSAQASRHSAMCSYAILKSAILWGDKFDSAAFKAFTENPVFENEFYRNSPTRVINVLTNLLFDLRDGSRNAAELSRRIERVYRHGRSVNEAPPGGPVGNAWVVAALTSGHLSLAQEILSFVRGEDVHSGIAHWFHARMSFDMGRGSFAAARFEDSSEILLDRIRELSAKASPSEVEIGLLGRLLLDGARSLAASGSADRALAILGNASVSMAELYERRPVVSWIRRLNDDIDLERSRLMAETLSLPRRGGKKEIFGIHESVLSRILELRQKLDSGSSGSSQIQKVADVARVLGTRSRSIDVFVIGQERLLELEAREAMLAQQQSYLDFAEWTENPSQQALWAWALVSSAYFNEFARSLRSDFESLQKDMKAAGKSDETLELISRIYGQSSANVHVAAKQQEIFERSIDPLAASRVLSRGEVIQVDKDEIFDSFTKLRNSLRDLQNSTGFRYNILELTGRSERVLVNLAAEAKVVLLSGLVEMRSDRKRFFEERSSKCLKGMQQSLVIMKRIATKYDEMANNRAKLRADWAVEIERARKARASSASNLEKVSDFDSGLLAAEIRAHLAARESAAKESFLHARASGLIGQEELQKRIENLEGYLEEAQMALDAALQHGELR